MKIIYLKTPQRSSTKHRAIGLTVKNNKIKVIELFLSNNYVNNVVIQGHTFEKVH